MGMLLYYPVPILLSFSLSFVVPSVVTMFKKNIHSLLNLNLNLTITTTTSTTQSQSQSVSGLALVTATTDNNLPNVLESTTLNSKKPSITENCPDPPSIGFVDGLMSCTESLGFESSDEWRVNNDRMVNSDENDEIWRKKMMTKKAENRGNLKRSFPPPLPSLNRNGKPSFYLRPVRKNGRLELTEVRIHRPDILHASRHDGRLTLHLIPDRDEEEDEEEEQEQEQEHVEEEEEEQEQAQQEENRGIPMLRRCHEMVNQQHLHVNHIRMCGISIV